MHLTTLVVAFIGCVAAIALGSRFLLTPRQATLAFGIAADNLRGLACLNGVRNITSGVVLFVIWLAAGPATLGWALIATALTPIADAIIVLTNRGRLSTALSRHGLAAGLLDVGLVRACKRPLRAVTQAVDAVFLIAPQPAVIRGAADAVVPARHCNVAGHFLSVLDHRQATTDIAWQLRFAHAGLLLRGDPDCQRCPSVLG
jgi:hypothetical protein